MKTLIIIIIAISFGNIYSKQENYISDLHQKLLSIPNLSVKSLDADSNFTEAFEIFVTQPVDHLNPNNGPKFTQRVYLHHIDFDKPMVMETDGYA
ncbi:MAG: hypothetical protein KDC52_08755, partial [Ignavibacteriae bacterium]|nr:hypothetical protein [Ignavibacteriota bacterium]